jgi:hypothetical protein
MTWRDLVREYFPDATDKLADWILWEKTGFPGFWNIPADGDTPEACCRKQLAALKAESEADPAIVVDPTRPGSDTGRTAP